MITSIEDILIFKTNIRTDEDRRRIQLTMDMLDGIEKWNVDLQDIDCVLRIESNKFSSAEIISIINYCGFECAELE
ncbi:MAG: hypothetical protein C5B52_09900 [Bacteroidetes bacterium]|nr:MAG: hypothetical protein C5B52_09900 [Bacteroidota bacterium]